MPNILKIASGITNPYSLLALTYLILFLIFRAVLSKVGPQRGKSAYRIIRQVMNLIAMIAVLTLLSVFGLKAYEIRADTTRLSRLADQLKSANLRVNYEVDKFTGANVLIGNDGQGVVIVSAITLHWKYRRCLSYEEPRFGAPLVKYRYTVELTKSEGSKLLDSRDFKYGPGEVDEFLVDLRYPDLGVYSIWISFTYRTLADETPRLYETPPAERVVCEK